MVVGWFAWLCIAFSRLYRSGIGTQRDPARAHHYTLNERKKKNKTGSLGTTQPKTVSRARSLRICVRIAVALWDLDSCSEVKILIELLSLVPLRVSYCKHHAVRRYFVATKPKSTKKLIDFDCFIF